MFYLLLQGSESAEEKSKNIFKIIGDGFTKGIPQNAQFYIIYFTVVISLSLIIYFLIGYIRRLIAEHKMNTLIFQSLCKVNGLNHQEKRTMKKLTEYAKNEGRFSIFFNRRIFDSYQSFIKDAKLKSSIVNKVYKIDAK
ncbi:MAG: hypothetical protein HY606_04240 [Planctomycetes bacterium]|nr:hypothetical protein [Planctomycetota bacterium]